MTATGPRDEGPAPATDPGPAPARDPGPGPIPLGEGISEDRASGRVAVYDTKLLRYVTAGLHADAAPTEVPGGTVTRTGRYQLRRV